MLLSWDRKRCSGPRFLPSGKRLGPYCCKREEASAASSPASLLVSRRFCTSSAVSACHAVVDVDLVTVVERDDGVAEERPYVNVIRIARFHWSIGRGQCDSGVSPASSRVVEDDPDGVTHPGTDAAHTMAEVHTIVALRTSHRPVMDGEGDSITLSKGHNLGAALHARPLFGQDELPTGEIHAGLREENRDLDRECEIAVEILVQAVEVARDVLQQQRRRARLSESVAPLEE